MTSSSSAGALAGPEDQPVVRLRSPTDVCEAVPFLVGFEPTRSLVVVSLRGPRQRAGVTARIDLPEPDVAAAVAEMVVDHLERDGASGAIVVAYEDRGGRGGDDAEGLADGAVQALLDACAERDIAVAEALRVADGRWTSYTCVAACCPPDGTPLRDRLAEPGEWTAAMALEGRQVLAGRSVLESSVAPVGGLLAAAIRARLNTEVDAFLAVVAAQRLQEYGDATVRLVREWVGRIAGGGTLTVDAAARLLVGLLDREVRDRCLGGGMGGLVGPAETALNGDALELWRELVRRAVLPRTAAPVATLLAACAYLDHGNGALANVALERALADQPSYVMAQYLRAMLDGGISPSMVRTLVAEPDAEDGTADPSRRCRP